MIAVLRLGHRPFRDQRITTHCGLVSRAFGAGKFIYSGQKDDKLESSIRKVVENFGGDFGVEYVDSWRKAIQEYRGRGFEIVHLTVYGLEIQKKIQKIRKKKDILVIIGGEKVPPEVYKTSDFNISITSQPHSEVSALAIFLDKYFKGKELESKLNGKKVIIPQEKGKKVLGN